ncbi:MAG: nuclear transport factor 2 family protein, partial [Alphaproteobacteria bacterium]|nr:nuclear transport factor 2 family protein [Alphaproteobacteria bacterium]MBV9904259.1 nuclear transport factor 2 family protein [Alphaproteobacteria bacterium]
FVDHGEAERVAELFEDDGVWASPENTMTGVAKIRAGFRQRQDNIARMSRHVCCNLLIDVVDADHASGTVYLTLYRHDGEPTRRTSPSAAPAIVGEYRDQFVRTSGGWRFARREIAVSFVAPQERRT